MTIARLGFVGLSNDRLELIRAISTYLLLGSFSLGDYSSSRSRGSLVVGVARLRAFFDSHVASVRLEKRVYVECRSTNVSTTVKLPYFRRASLVSVEELPTNLMGINVTMDNIENLFRFVRFTYVLRSNTDMLEATRVVIINLERAYATRSRANVPRALYERDMKRGSVFLRAKFNDTGLPFLFYTSNVRSKNRSVSPCPWSTFYFFHFFSSSLSFFFRFSVPSFFLHLIVR